MHIYACNELKENVFSEDETPKLKVLKVQQCTKINKLNLSFSVTAHKIEANCVCSIP